MGDCKVGGFVLELVALLAMPDAGDAQPSASRAWEYIDVTLVVLSRDTI